MDGATTVSLVEIINQTGFPIAACVGLFWLVNKTLKSQQEILQDLKTAIINNTAAIAEISASLKKGQQ